VSKLLDEVLAANVTFAADFKDREQPAVPARRFAILTCMDARLDPVKLAGLREGDAHVIRNAGGRASDDAIRSLLVSHKLLGTTEWFVIHHTNCGMENFTDEIVQELMVASGWHYDSEHPYAQSIEFMDWLRIADQPQSVKSDVERIRNHPLVPKDIAIYGYIYDVTTGLLVEVVEATAAGRAG
jgi:carbonic anhydrase